MKKLIIHHHLGLGDHIICNGLVNYLIEKYRIEELLLITKKINLETVQHLYRDSQIVKPVIFDECTHTENQFSGDLSSTLGIPLLKITFLGDGLFDKYFYESVDVPFESRWTHFKLPNEIGDEAKILLDEKTKGIGGEYCLIGNQASIGSFDIKIQTALPVINLERKTKSLLDWVEIIREAREIHCIDSSFIHLVDSLEIGGKELYYHDVGRGSKFQLKNHWQTINHCLR